MGTLNIMAFADVTPKELTELFRQKGITTLFIDGDDNDNLAKITEPDDGALMVVRDAKILKRILHSEKAELIRDAYTIAIAVNSKNEALSIKAKIFVKDGAITNILPGFRPLSTTLKVVKVAHLSRAHMDDDLSYLTLYECLAHLSYQVQSPDTLAALVSAVIARCQGLITSNACHNILSKFKVDTSLFKMYEDLYLEAPMGDALRNAYADIAVYKTPPSTATKDIIRIFALDKIDARRVKDDLKCILKYSKPSTYERELLAKAKLNPDLKALRVGAKISAKARLDKAKKLIKANVSKRNKK